MNKVFKKTSFYEYCATLITKGNTYRNEDYVKYVGPFNAFPAKHRIVQRVVSAWSQRFYGETNAVRIYEASKRRITRPRKAVLEDLQKLLIEKGFPQLKKCGRNVETFLPFLPVDFEKSENPQEVLEAFIANSKLIAGMFYIKNVDCSSA